MSLKSYLDRFLISKPPLVDFREGLLETILDSSIDAIITINEESKVIEWNKAAELMFGYGKKEAVGQDVTKLIIPVNYRAQHRVGIKRWLSNRSASKVLNQRLELPAIVRSGQEIPVELTVVASETTKGAIFTATVRNITERKRKSERIRLVQDEQKHRIKNIMAVIQSLAQRSFKDVDKEQVAPFLSRIFAMSKAYDILFMEDFKKVNLKDVVEAIIYTYEKGENFRISGVPFEIPSNAAVSFALVIHELSTNAVKYGALSVPEGYVEITWAKMGEKLLWAWQEFDGPAVNPEPKKGFGYSLITRAFTGEGETKLEFNTKGVKCTLSLVLDYK